MLRIVARFLSDRFDHPMFVGVILVGALFLAVSSLATMVMGGGLTAGFFAVYAVIALFIGVMGYVSLYLVKFTAWARRRLDVGQSTVPDRY